MHVHDDMLCCAEEGVLAVLLCRRRAFVGFFLARIVLHEHLGSLVEGLQQL